LSRKQKAAKGGMGIAHGRATGGTGRANLFGNMLALNCWRHGLCLQGTGCVCYFCI